MLYCCRCPDVKHQDIGGKKKKKILIQLSLFYIDVAQNKTKQKKIKNKKKKKKKNKKSIFQTIEVLNDLSKLKSDFLCFNTFFYVKKKLTCLCFSACFINMVLQYLRQLHNLSSFLS